MQTSPHETLPRTFSRNIEIMAHLFDSLKIRDITFPNRVFVSPMCEYSSTDGYANDWHFVHLGSRAVGGAGLVMTEATAVVAEGRISPEDLGIWKDDHIAPLARIVRFIHEQGSVAGMQLAHAGRKASTYRPWDGNGKIAESAGGWTNVVAPSAVPFADHYPMPQALSVEGIKDVVKGFVAAARRAGEAGFDVIEIHAAHGYLIHEFLSPLSNQRSDAYGGSFENRTRILHEVVAAVREVRPAGAPLFVRISATDWVEGGWDIRQSVALSRELKKLGVDLVDCSSGGNVNAKIPVGPAYQTPFAEQIRREAGILTGTVGMITGPQQAEDIVNGERADAVLLAREMLRDPYWPLRAARELGQKISWPVQYLRAAPENSKPREAAAHFLDGVAAGPSPK
jgi:2,4-dienoyl-CoA reductase-like NADH-dependent reductase (Old Yellow Enzyme family)